VLHATVPSADRRPSKKSFSPRVVLSGVWGLSGGIAWRVSSAGKPIWSADLGSGQRTCFGMGRCWRWPAARFPLAWRLPATVPVCLPHTDQNSVLQQRLPRGVRCTSVFVFRGSSRASRRASARIRRRAASSPRSISEPHGFRVAAPTCPKLRSVHSQVCRSTYHRGTAWA